jgi:hypothetical protein
MTLVAASASRKNGAQKNATAGPPHRSYPAKSKEASEEDSMDGTDGIAHLGVFLVPIVGSIALFSFLAVASWSEARRKEREAYYTADALKKIADSSAEGAKSAVEYLREQYSLAARKRVEGLKLGGLITAAVGIGMIAMLRGLDHDEPSYLIGLIPLLIGVALMFYGFALAPKAQIEK